MTVEKSVVVPLGPDETFALITEPERLRRWQVITARVELRAGGDYRWTVIPGNVARGTFIELEPGRRVVFSWGWEGSPILPPGASTVTITLEPGEGGTLVRLVHEGLDDEQAARHAMGWDHYLGRLAQAAAGGDAGPDEWAATPYEPDELKTAEAALAVCQSVLRGITRDAYERPTVCPEFSVAGLTGHLIGSVTKFGGAAGAESTGAGRDSLEDRLASQVLGIAQAIISPQVRASGSFASPLGVSPDAPAMDRLIAFTGREAH